MTDLHCDIHGKGEPTMILLHGVGANGAVFAPLIERLGAWPGRIIVPDMRGHGRSPWARNYAIGHHAADVASLVPPYAPVHLVGHSMGGAVSVMLASGFFGVNVERVSGFGVKVIWSEDELRKAEAVAVSPVRWFDSRDEAATRFLRVAGIDGRFGLDHPAVDAGIVEDGGRWRLAADNGTMRAANISSHDMMIAARKPMQLFCGAEDPMMTVDEIKPYDANAFEIAGARHNAHVDAPDAVAAAILAWHMPR